MSERWKPDDPFADPGDPAAREREERRREREEKRRMKAERQAKKEAGPAGGEPGVGSAPPPGASEAPVPVASEEEQAPRTLDEEFWDEGSAEPSLGGGSPPDGGLPPEHTPSPPPPRGGGRSAGSGRGGGGRGGVLGALRRHPFRIAGIVLALVVVWFLWSLFQPFHGDGSGHVPVTIPKGASVSEVGDILDAKGVVDSSTLFQIRTTLAGKRSDLYAGHFSLAHGMSYGAAIEALSKPPPKRVLTVTIPEGYSRPQAAQLVEEDGLPGSYTKATVRSRYLDPAKYGGKGARDLEGFLFPDTFELKPNAPVEDLVQLQLEDFRRRIKGVDMRYAKSKNLTVFDVLTIASMVEREAGVPKQRRLVASVIYNRLHEGMPLGIDATIRFATGNYTRPLTESQLAIDSPYNTRTNAGLPPGPINSPGLAAIEAAAHPARRGYLYYVNDPDSCNELSFAKTSAEFEADVEKYERAREANGGNAPSTCGE